MMRLTLDYVTFSVIGISAVFISPIFLQLPEASSALPANYPLRLELPLVPLARTNSSETNSSFIRPNDESLQTDNSDAAPEQATGKQMAAETFDARFASSEPAKSIGSEKWSVGNLMAVQYDLGNHVERSAGMSVQSSKALAGMIDVRKRIRVGKAAPTRIDVKVGTGANIYVHAAQLSSILGTEGKVLDTKSEAISDGFVSLEDLRNNGFNVRYDAAGDALVVDSDA